MSRFLFVALVITSIYFYQQPTLNRTPGNWEEWTVHASLEVVSQTFLMDNGECQVRSRLRVMNVGLHTLAIIGFDATFTVNGSLKADWDRNSLLHSDFYFGVSRLRRVGEIVPHRTTISTDDATQSWHALASTRTVDFTFVQPTQGSGQLLSSFLLETQPVDVDLLAENLSEARMVRGRMLSVMPEFGKGEVSTLPVYPYSAADVVVIPPGCWTEAVGPGL